MGWFHRQTKTPTTHAAVGFPFRQCPGCSYDFITGEGTRSCSWYECPYLPEELKVFCPECNYNFATREGNPRCADPPTCGFAVEGYRHARTARKLFRDVS